MTKPCFVVQKHDASRLHYDFRLEVDGVLKSWAVPKGPSLVTKMKRLAVAVEDHEMDWRNFEGVIDDEDYGGGTVMIWDEGALTWGADADPAEIFETGVVAFSLEGKKLKGRFKLIHAKLGGDAKNWLLIKRKDEFAESEDDLLKREPTSARTGRTLEEIAAEEAAG